MNCQFWHALHLQYTSSDWLNKTSRAKPGFAPAIGPAIECLTAVGVAWCAVGVVQSLVIRCWVQLIHFLPCIAWGDERKGHAEPHLNVRLLAKWLMAAVAPPYCSSCPYMLTARNAFGLQCFLGASMFDINCPREGRVGTLLNPNSVLRYEYCHVLLYYCPCLGLVTALGMVYLLMAELKYGFHYRY